MSALQPHMTAQESQLSKQVHSQLSGSTCRSASLIAEFQPSPGRLCEDIQRRATVSSYRTLLGSISSGTLLSPLTLRVGKTAQTIECQGLRFTQR